MVHEVPAVLRRVKWVKTPGSNVVGRMMRADSVFCVFADLVIYCRVEFVRKKFCV